MKRRRLGQHYLVDDRIVDKMLAHAGVKPFERVLEIGTGRGALTKRLADMGAKLLAYEIDNENYRLTKLALGVRKNVDLRNGDAFAQRDSFDVLVSSLPYSESSKFVVWLCGIEFDRAVVLLQDDFVRKLTAQPGTKDYRAISVIAQISSRIIVVSSVGRDAFVPRPRVASAIVEFRPLIRISPAEVLKVKRLFSLRRRLVRGVIKGPGTVPGGKFGSRRIVSLTPEEVHLLCSPD
jgi:16S rRNA (adenine1518-N6/adenine1519-N6)-dimethyltransferase